MTNTATATANTYGLMATPALDLAPTGHLPYIVEQARPHPEIDGAREHTEVVDRDELTAALPEAVHAAMRSALPEKYTPELADAIAAGVVAKLRQQQEPRPLTAAQRGPQWMARWGCPGFCVEEHGKPGALECHSTAPIETSILAADMDCSGYSENGESLPWMTAQVVVNNEKAQAYGRQTRVWMGYGVHLAEISPAEARRALDAMRAFTVRLAAAVDFAEQVAEDDFRGDPEIARLDMDAADRRARGITEGRA
jgi:hypothetical protein